MSHPRRLVGLLVGVTLLGVAGEAGAHVDAEITGTTAGDANQVILIFDHGCDGAATDGLDVQLPHGAEVVTTTEPPGWSASTDDGVLAWAGPAIPDGETTSFGAALRLPQPVGSSVSLPVIQRCGQEQEAWVEGAGTSHPAPTVVVAASTPAPTPDPATADTTTTSDAVSPPDGGDDLAAVRPERSTPGDGEGIPGLVLAIGGLAVAITVALAVRSSLRQRRRLGR